MTDNFLAIETYIKKLREYKKAITSYDETTLEMWILYKKPV